MSDRHCSPHYSTGSGDKDRDPSCSERSSLPPPITSLLTPEWYEACAKLGFNPHPWASYRDPHVSQARWVEAQARMAELEEERARERAEKDNALDWLLTIIEHNKPAVLRALGISTWRDGDYNG